MTTLYHHIANVLDTLALLVVKLGLLQDAHIQFDPDRISHKLDVWTEPNSWNLHFRGFVAVVDR